MKPCEDCKQSPGNGRACVDKIYTCPDHIGWLRWRLEHELHADPQETRPVERESETLSSAERNE